MRRGLDITDCEAGTKIRSKYLRALEEEQFEVLPGPTYVRGFLRSYAEFLELDGRLVLEEYESRFERPREISAYEEVLRRGRMRRRSRESRFLGVASTLALLGAVVVWVGVDGRDAPARQAPPVTAVFSSVGRQATYVEAREGGPDGRLLFPASTIPSARPVSVSVQLPMWVHVGEGSGLRLMVDGRPLETPDGRTEFRVLPTGVILTSATQ